MFKLRAVPRRCMGAGVPAVAGLAFVHGFSQYCALRAFRDIPKGRCCGPLGRVAAFRGHQNLGKSAHARAHCASPRDKRVAQRGRVATSQLEVRVREWRAPL